MNPQKYFDLIRDSEDSEIPHAVFEVTKEIRIPRKNKNEHRVSFPHKRRHDKKSAKALEAKLRRLSRRDHPRNQG